jgi:alkylation response protein AidB-like acyl-CoA dehydrogenase
MYRLNEGQWRILEKVKSVADSSVAPHAARVDRDRAFPKESMAALAEAGLLGLTVPAEFGGMGQGLRTLAASLDEVAQRCASTAMVYLMHACGVACYAAAPDRTRPLLVAAARGAHLSTLAFSEKGSRSHFWAPVSKAEARNGGLTLTAQKSFVTSAGHADGYVVSTLSTAATQPIESTIYLVMRDDSGVKVSGAWDGLGMRGNASAPMSLENVVVTESRALTAPGKGLEMMLGVVLPMFQVGTAAVALGLAEAAVAATAKHLTSARLDHLGSRLADLPIERARLAQMRLATDRARAHLVCVLDAIEAPGPSTQLLVLEAKAAATETAVEVTELAMRACGGAAFGGAHGIERFYRDARAPIVMAPTTDQALDFIGRALCGMEVF